MSAILRIVLSALATILPSRPERQVCKRDDRAAIAKRREAATPARPPNAAIQRGRPRTVFPPGVQPRAQTAS